MNAEALVKLTFESQKQLLAVLEALTPEFERKIGVRSKTSVMIDDHLLVLRFEAEDTIALRAALNAHLRWVSSAINVLETVNKEP